MKKHSKVGNRAGKPAYRTPSAIRNKRLAAGKGILPRDRKSGKK